MQITIDFELKRDEFLFLYAVHEGFNPLLIYSKFADRMFAPVPAQPDDWYEYAIRLEVKGGGTVTGWQTVFFCERLGFIEGRTSQEWTVKLTHEAKQLLYEKWHWIDEWKTLFLTHKVNIPDEH